MSGTVSSELLRLLADSTADEQAAMVRFLRGGDLGRGGPQYVLQKGLRGWRLVFDGLESVLPHEKGVAYVSVLLAKPDELLPAAELANRAFGDAVIEEQRNIATDDRESLEAMRLARRKCQAVLDDTDASEVERE